MTSAPVRSAPRTGRLLRITRSGRRSRLMRRRRASASGGYAAPESCSAADEARDQSLGPAVASAASIASKATGMAAHLGVTGCRSRSSPGTGWATDPAAPSGQRRPPRSRRRGCGSRRRRAAAPAIRGDGEQPADRGVVEAVEQRSRPATGTGGRLVAHRADAARDDGAHRVQLDGAAARRPATSASASSAEPRCASATATNDRRGSPRGARAAAGRGRSAPTSSGGWAPARPPRGRRAAPPGRARWARAACRRRSPERRTTRCRSRPRCRSRRRRRAAPRTGRGRPPR